MHFISYPLAPPLPSSPSSPSVNWCTVVATSSVLCWVQLFHKECIRDSIVVNSLVFISFNIIMPRDTFVNAKIINPKLCRKFETQTIVFKFNILL